MFEGRMVSGSRSCFALRRRAIMHGGARPRGRGLRLATLLLFALVVLASGARAEFMVNMYTTGDQISPDVALNPDHSFVVVWHDDARAGIFARHNEEAPEFKVNTSTADLASFPSVAINDDGSFLVVWDGPDLPTGEQILVQRFAADAVKLGTEFPVSSTNSGSNVSPHVALDGGGNSVIVWNNQDSGGDIFGFLLDSNGMGTAGFLLTPATFGDLVFNNAVTSFPDGRFVVVWEESGGIHGDESDLPALSGARFQASSGTIPVGQFTHPSVASDAHGNFVVVWEATGGYGVFGQRFSSDAVPLGTEFQVGDPVDADHRNFSADVARDPGGAFDVAWTHLDVSKINVFVQRFDSAGAPVGAAIQVSHRPVFLLNTVSIGANGGDFVVAWDGYASDSHPSGKDVFAAHYTGQHLLGPVMKMKVVDAKTQWFWFLHIGEPHYTAQDLSAAPKDGATLTLSNPATGQQASFLLPPGPAWKPLRSGGVKYIDRKNEFGPCRKLVAIPGKSLVVGCAPGDGSDPFPLRASAQGSLNVAVRFGTGDALCSGTAGGTVLTDDPATLVLSDIAPVISKRGVFAVKNAPQPDPCELP